MNIAIIFAGGVGKRMGAKIPKQFLKINGKPILIHTLELFQNHNNIDKIYISTIESYIPYVKEICEQYGITKLNDVVEGGNSAQESIYNALKRASEENDPDSIVLIHDGVRPFITEKVISNNIEGVKKHGNAITCTSCYETIIVSNSRRNNRRCAI